MDIHILGNPGMPALCRPYVSAGFCLQELPLMLFNEHRDLRSATDFTMKSVKSLGHSRYLLLSGENL